jgi:anti-sigma-K factor RskA
MSAADLSEEDDLLAAELALGVLVGAERAEADARERDEPAFAAAVTRWRSRFSVLEPGTAALPPWPLIEAKLPANDTGKPTSSAAVGRWRAAAIGFGMAAAVLLALLLRPPLQEAPLVATLSSADRASVVAVGIDRASGRLVVQPSALQAALDRRVAELWVVPSDGRPRSLGTVDPAAPRALGATGEARSALVPDATLAISLEPPGGSPTGQPTGPVILSGKITRL